MPKRPRRAAARRNDMLFAEARLYSKSGMVKPKEPTAFAALTVLA